jgi:hypothetical protein
LRRRHGLPLVECRAAGVLLDQFDALASLILRDAAAGALRPVWVSGLGLVVALLRTEGEPSDAVGGLSAGSNSEGKQAGRQYRSRNDAFPHGFLL